MKTKKHFIALLMLALFALTACSGKKTDDVSVFDNDDAWFAGKEEKNNDGRR